MYLHHRSSEKIFTRNKFC